MGQILILEGEDFSGNPNAINVAELPVITQDLYGFWTGLNSEVDNDGAILNMPSVFSSGPVMTRIPGESRSPIYYEGSSFFVGNVLRFSDSHSPNPTPGLVGTASYDLSDGISFTWMIRIPVSTTGTNRVLLGIQPLGIQFRINSNSGTGHLQIGATHYDVGLHGTSAGVYAITLVVKKNEAILYKDGVGLSPVDISAASLPELSEGALSLGSNWLGNVGLEGHQIKQFYYHSKALDLAQVQKIHGSLPSILV